MGTIVKQSAIAVPKVRKALVKARLLLKLLVKCVVKALIEEVVVSRVVVTKMASCTINLPQRFR